MKQFFLHLRPKKIPEEALKISNTFGLGGATFFFFILTVVTGILLMFYYTPDLKRAYYDIKKITNIIPYGSMIRDIHRLAGELMIIFSFLHMARVILKDAYIDKTRKANWKYGVMLFILIFPLNFTGYILPADTIGYWGASIVLNAINEIPFFGKYLRILISGSVTIDNSTILRFYAYHIVLLPLIFILLFFIHIYYVRKVRGVKVKNFTPFVDFSNLLKIEIFASLVIFVILLFIVINFYNSPLGDYPFTNSIPEKVEAPWYFLNFQLLLIFFNPVIVVFFLPVCYIAYLIRFPDFNSKSFFFILHFVIIFLIFLFKWMET